MLRLFLIYCFAFTGKGSQTLSSPQKPLDPVSAFRLARSKGAAKTVNVPPTTTYPTYLGCWKDGGPRDLPIQDPQSSQMTIEICAADCAAYPYFGLQNANQCFCGKSYGNNNYTQLAESSCNKNCNGNSSQICGGTNANSIYSHIPNPLGTYLGCYADKSSAHDLPGLNLNFDHMTIEFCAGKCAAYPYYGLQGNTCWCGMNYSTYGPSTACTSTCGGDPSETCGGSSANSVYQHATPYFYRLGCYTQNVNGNDLRDYGQSNGLNTVELCASQCTGYPYFGVIDDHCWCDYRYGTNGINNNCNHNCPGNVTEACGGGGSGNCLDVYQYTPTPPTPTPLVTPTSSCPSFVGCYIDGSSRDLPVEDYYYNTQTVELCAADCALYPYFSLQNSDTCFCGNTYGHFGPATDCDMTCKGNANETCGGSWANSIWTHIPQSNLLGTYLGCYAESSPRSLPYGQFSWPGMTVENCAAKCAAYPYYSVQNGNQCFCGYSLPTTASSTNCDHSCAGNPAETCGGSSANSVYQHAPITYSSLGCYADTNPSTHDLRFYGQSMNPPTVESCASQCTSYLYFGLQGNTCWCDNQFGTQGVSTSCTTPCSGNTAQICGGSKANSVYSYCGSVCGANPACATPTPITGAPVPPPPTETPAPSPPTASPAPVPPPPPTETPCLTAPPQPQS